MDIRPAVVGDLDTLNAIAHASKATWGYSPEQMAAWHDELTITADALAQRPTFVIEEGGDIAGFVRLDDSVQPWALDAMWVRPRFLRRGVGRALVRHATDLAVAAGQAALTIDADPNAADFYRALGAFEVGTVPAPIAEEPARVRPQFILATDAMEPLRTERLSLRPLRVEHADAMYPLLQDPALYAYLDYDAPPSLEHVRDNYARLMRRVSPDGRDRWLNWIVFDADDRALGYVQATVARDGRTWVAFVIHPDHWGHGYAFEATAAMTEHLAAPGRRFMATVEEDNVRSIRLLERLGFARAGRDADHDVTSTELLYTR